MPSHFVRSIKQRINSNPAFHGLCEYLRPYLVDESLIALINHDAEG